MASTLQATYTARDLAILRGLFESRLMSRAQIAAIYFAGHERMAKKRIQKLSADRLVDARPRRLDQPKLHFLTKRGFYLLKNGGHLPNFPSLGYLAFRRRIDVSTFTQEHELSVMDVKAAFFQAIHGDATLRIAEFSTWPLLFRFPAPSASSGRMAWFSADGFIRIHRLDTEDRRIEQLFYLEVDRSTETLSVLCRKSAAFMHHFQSGGMALRFGGTRDEYKRFGFRVLWVFQNAERRNNAAAAFLTANPPILSQAWMTTLAEVLLNPFGNIWVRPRDYYDAVRGTPYDIARSDSVDATYRRQSARESHVEKAIAKHAILLQDLEKNPPRRPG
jgi:hypothetical protein